MKTTNRDLAERLIIEFLAAHDSPTAADWKVLIDKYPEFASDFVDAALIREAGDAAEASKAPFDVDPALAGRTVSRVLNMLHQRSVAQTETVAKAVGRISGPAARRQLAQRVGIGDYPSLLNGILCGRTVAPKKLLDALSAALGVQSIALREFLIEIFARSPTPAYKAEEKKPHVYLQPATWEQAVKGLDLPVQETQRLLRFGDENEA